MQTFENSTYSNPFTETLRFCDPYILPVNYEIIVLSQLYAHGVHLPLDFPGLYEVRVSSIELKLKADTFVSKATHVSNLSFEIYCPS